MTNIIYVADFTVDDYYGGAEMVDKNITEYLGIPVTRTRELLSIDTKAHYILSNTLNMHPSLKEEFTRQKNYSIFEHDYKIHKSRQPNRYPSNIFPESELLPIEVKLLHNAKNVFVQSSDHLECYIHNGIKANYYNLRTSIWSQEELDKLDIIGSTAAYTTHEWAVIDSKVPEKGTAVAIEWCKQNNIDFALIPRTNKDIFYKNLSEHPTLIYMPIVKESFCRVVVEARCMYMNVVTPKTYGAVKEPWFKLKGIDMIKFLKERSKENISTIIKYSV